MPRRRSRKRPQRKASSSSSLGVWLLWLLVVALAGAAGWLWYRAATMPGGPDDRLVADATEPVGPIPEAPRFEGPRSEAPPVPPVPPVFSLPPAEPVPSAPAATNSAGANPPPARPRETNAPPDGPNAPGPLPEPRLKLSTERLVAVQVALARRGISSGSIDGVPGPQTHAALRIFQRSEGLPVTGDADAATLKRLDPPGTAYETYTVTAADLTRITTVPRTWLEKSTRTRLDYESVLEMVAELSHSHPRLIRALNPGVDWAQVRAGTVVRIPQVGAVTTKARAAVIRISLAEKTLRVFDARSNLLLHFPCSIARKVEKRPVGELHVAKIAPHPNYRFDPEIFPESEEARKLKRRLMIPPGPNNPVGTAWIGLDRPGYGIHGTPNPEDVGRTESHGCFRLSNWNAELLVKMAWVGLPVVVEP